MEATTRDDSLEQIAPGFVVRERKVPQRMTSAADNIEWSLLREEDANSSFARYPILRITVTPPSVSYSDRLNEGSIKMDAGRSGYDTTVDITEVTKPVRTLILRAEKLLVETSKELAPKIAKAKSEREAREKKAAEQRAKVDEARKKVSELIAEFETKMAETLRWHEGSEGRMWTKGKKGQTTFKPLGEVHAALNTSGGYHAARGYVNLTIGRGPSKGQRRTVYLRDIIRVEISNEEGKRHYDNVELPKFPEKEVNAARRAEEKLRYG